MENTPQEAVLKTLPLVDIPEKNIRIRYIIIIYTNLITFGNETNNKSYVDNTC